MSYYPGQEGSSSWRMPRILPSKTNGFVLEKDSISTAKPPENSGTALSSLVVVIKDILSFPLKGIGSRKKVSYSGGFLAGVDSSRGKGRSRGGQEKGRESREFHVGYNDILFVANNFKEER